MAGVATATATTKKPEPESESDVVLHTNWSSVYSRRVAIALREKRIPFEEKEEDLFNKREKFVALSPVIRQVPVLVHKGRSVVESSVILEYIDEVWPQEPALVPRDPHQRAVARFWVGYVNKFAENLVAIIYKNGQLWDAAKIKSVNMFKTLENALAADSSMGRPYFLGGQLGIVDICFAPFAPLLSPLFEKLGDFKFPPASECPRVHAWIETLLKNRTVTAFSREVDGIVKLAEPVFNKFRHEDSWTGDSHF